MDSVFEQINKLSATVFKNPHLKLKSTDTPSDVDGWDSLTHIVLISAIEDHFSIEFNFRDLAGIKAVGDLVHTVELKLRPSQDHEA